MSEQIIKAARELCEKFIDKVETGRAISKETYADCKALLKLIDENEQGLRPNDANQSTYSEDALL